MRLKTNNKILVTGGAGYIGSHTCKVPGKAAYLPIAFDNPVDGSTHGAPQSLPIAEDHIQTPVNPYGQSKLIMAVITIPRTAPASGIISMSPTLPKRDL